MKIHQYQITQIANGWLVGTPPEQPTQQNPEGVPPMMHFCEDYSAVTVCLKQLWPKESNIAILK